MLDELRKHNIIYTKNNKEKINPNSSRLLQNNLSLLEKINEKTAFLNPFNPSIIERIFTIKNNINKLQLCPVCQTKLKFKYNYSITCSYKCLKQYERQQINIKTGKTLSQLRIEKVKKSNNKIGLDGLTSYQRGIKKTFSKMSKEAHDERVKKIINTKKLHF